MQKLWFKSKRSQPLLPEEDIHSSSPATEDSQQTSTTPVLSNSETVGQEAEKFTLTKQGILKYFSQIPQKSPEWQISPTWVILTLGVGGIAIVTMLGMQYLTAPEATPDSTLTCRSKISGDWQTPIGKLTLQEERGDVIAGKYEYTNFDRGKIIGEFTGKLNNNVINFDWQETPKQQPKQQGKGILIFGEGCKEFYGSYGTGDSTSNFGNWQGSRMSK
jgi:hypothetical protein